MSRIQEHEPRSGSAYGFMPRLIAMEYRSAPKMDFAAFAH